MRNKTVEQSTSLCIEDYPLNEDLCLEINVRGIFAVWRDSYGVPRSDFWDAECKHHEIYEIVIYNEEGGQYSTEDIDSFLVFLKLCFPEVYLEIDKLVEEWTEDSEVLWDAIYMPEEHYG